MDIHTWIDVHTPSMGGEKYLKKIDVHTPPPLPPAAVLAAARENSIVSAWARVVSSRVYLYCNLSISISIPIL